MSDLEEFTLYKASCVQNPKNCVYPEKVVVRTAEEFDAVARFDHVAAEYKNSYRGNDGFLCSDVQIFDVDNDGVTNPDNWITKNDIHNIFEGTTHVITESKHHMKPKGNKPPAPRLHIYFKAESETDFKKYTAFKERMQKHFPFIDKKALDAGRYFDGSEHPNAEFYSGTMTINDFLDRLEAEDMEKQSEAEKPPDTDIIPEGSRNSTLFHSALCTLKHLGNTEEARERYRRESERCSPPLDKNELNGIWKSALKYYDIIRKQPGYILPDQFNRESVTEGVGLLQWARCPYCPAWSTVQTVEQSSIRYDIEAGHTNRSIWSVPPIARREKKSALRTRYGMW